MAHAHPHSKHSSTIKTSWQRMLPWMGCAVVIAGLTVAAALNIETINKLVGFDSNSDKTRATKVATPPRPSVQTTITTVEKKATSFNSKAEPVSEITSETNKVVESLPSPKPKRYYGPLPKLSNSDTQILQALADLLFHPKLANWFVSEELVNKLVLAVDNIANGDTINKHRPVHSPKTQFQADSSQKPELIDEKNYRRYYVYVDLLESFDINQAMVFYQHYQPLFQQAYAEMGYPKKSFNKRLLQAIDMLLATPMLQHDLTLVRPSVLFKFADRQIEALPSAQKWLLRMGEENRTRIKRRLRDIRAALVNAGL